MALASGQSGLECTTLCIVQPCTTNVHLAEEPLASATRGLPPLRSLSPRPSTLGSPGRAMNLVGPGPKWQQPWEVQTGHCGRQQPTCTPPVFLG